MPDPNKVAVLIPAFNQRPWDPGFVRRLRGGLMAVKEAYGAQICLVFVDDGSSRDGTSVEDHVGTLRQVGVETIRSRHPLNRGQGASLQTALCLARCPAIGATHFITMDADGQHDPDDLVPLLAPVFAGEANIAFGNRFDPAMLAEGIPASRRAILRMAAVFDQAFTGLRLTDAHNGLRAFDTSTAEVIDIQQDRMAHATEFKQIVADHDLRYVEVPVHITYTDETLGAGQGNLNAVNIVRELARAWWLG